MSGWRGDTIFLLAVVGSAFSIFQTFDAFISFCNWLQPVIFYWRYYLYLIFDYVFFWLPFTIPSAYKDIFATIILFSGVITRSVYLPPTSSLGTEIGTESRSRYQAFLVRSLAFSSGAVAFFFLVPVFGWKPDFDTKSALTEVVSTMGVLVKLLLSVGAIGFLYLIPDGDEGDAIRKSISRQMWRILLMITALLCLNQVGLWADNIPPLIEINLVPQGL